MLPSNSDCDVLLLLSVDKGGGTGETEGTIFSSVTLEYPSLISLKYLWNYTFYILIIPKI